MIEQLDFLRHGVKIQLSDISDLFLPSFVHCILLI